MQKISNGEDATLGNYRKLAIAVFGYDSKAVKFLNDKIASFGENEPVIADESQMLYFLAQISKELKV